MWQVFSDHITYYSIFSFFTSPVSGFDDYFFITLLPNWKTTIQVVGPRSTLINSLNVTIRWFIDSTTELQLVDILGFFFQQFHLLDLKFFELKLVDIWLFPIEITNCCNMWPFLLLQTMEQVASIQDLSSVACSSRNQYYQWKPVIRLRVVYP